MAALGLAVMALAGCTTTSQTPRPSGPVLRVGIANDTAPMTSRVSGQWTGIEIDLAKALAAELDRPVKFVSVKPFSLSKSLENGKIDVIMASTTAFPTEGREVQSCKPWLSSGIMAVVKSENLALYPNGVPQPFPGVVGIQEGTRSEFFMRIYFPEEEPVVFKTSKEALAGLKAGKVDLLFHDSLTAWWLRLENAQDGIAVVNRPIGQRNLLWWVGIEDEALRTSVNAFITSIHQDGRLREIIANRLPDAR